MNKARLMCWWLSLVLLLPAAVAAQAPDASFGMYSRLTAERGAVGNVAVGDADGDGRADLAVMEFAQEHHSLRLYFQRADGSLAAHVLVPISADWNDVYSVTMVDLDGDGALEVAVGAHGGINIVRWGAARLPSMTYHEGPSSSCRIITSGDVDGDGRQDIVCHGRNEWPNMAVVYFGNGQGGVRNILGVETGSNDSGGHGGHEFKGLAVGDVTGDGHADLVVTSASTSSFQVIPNDGNGGFLPRVAYAHPVSPYRGWPVSVVVTDLDGDSVNEVVTANTENEPDGRLNIYKLGGTGALLLSRQIPIHSSTTAMLVGDVGGDGDKDIVLGHWSYGAVSVLGDSDAGLETQARYELPGFGNDVLYVLRTGSTNALALGDLNGDGCKDLAGATYSGVSILYGCKPYATTLPVSDFDGDGVSDIFWRQGQMGGFHMLWPWATKDVPCPLPCPPYHGLPPYLNQAVGDFDGDGSSDVFYRNTETGENLIVLRAFYEEPGVTIADQDWQVVGAGDFDGDDHSDLFWRNTRTGQNMIWRRGQHQGRIGVQGVPDPGWKVGAIGDFDGDGRSDLFWRHSSSGRNIVWWAGGMAGTNEMSRVKDTQWRIFGAGDFNQDGRDDVVWRHVSTGAGIIWHSGDARTPMVMTAIIQPDWWIIGVGDYNADGISDLLWQNQASGANIIWRSARSSQPQRVAPIDPTYKPVI